MDCTGCLSHFSSIYSILEGRIHSTMNIQCKGIVTPCAAHTQPRVLCFKPYHMPCDCMYSGADRPRGSGDRGGHPAGGVGAHRGPADGYRRSGEQERGAGRLSDAPPEAAAAYWVRYLCSQENSAASFHVYLWDEGIETEKMFFSSRTQTLDTGLSAEEVRVGVAVWVAGKICT